ncbi:MAG: BMP family ABC transporter substrate-binding protein, partial [Candidatus Limnocylindria bacterium]
MRKHPSAMVAMLAIVMLILAACNGGGESPAASDPASMAPESMAPESMAPESEAPDESAEAATIKACMVSDVGGIDDNSFNENAWLGMEEASDELGAEVSFLESRSA